MAYHYFALCLGLASGAPNLEAIDRDFDHAAVQLRLARGNAEWLSGRVTEKTARDPLGAAASLRNEIHSMRKEFDTLDSSFGKDLSPEQFQNKLTMALNPRDLSDREPREPKWGLKSKKVKASAANTSSVNHRLLAEKAKRHPWFKAKRAPRCTKKNPSQRSKEIKKAAKKGKAHSMIETDSFRGGGRRRVPTGEVSASLPGAGGKQKLADEGLSTTGTVNHEEPMMSVYKDGYSEVGCYADSMPEFSDKFGDNSDQYRAADGVSVVWYKQHVLKEKQEPMWPYECYTFCRTVPHMVFFGIMNGGNCYCAPYFKPMAGAAVKCEMPCPGNPTFMCGGQKTSSIFEMHFCNNAGEDLKDAAIGAGEILLYFEQEAWTLNEAATALNKAGDGLQKVAGKGGDPLSGDLAQLAKKSAGEWENLLKDGTCFQAFTELQTQYEGSKPIFESDLMAPANLEKADWAIFEMTSLSKTVNECAKKAEEQNIFAYPWHEEVQTTEDLSSWWSDHLDEVQLIAQTYYPLQYGLNPTTTLTDADVTMSSCSGTPIGAAMPLYFSECAGACEKTIFPKKCIGFQQYTGDDFGPLCVMYSEFDKLSTFKCPEQEWPALLQKKANATKKTNATKGDVNCFDVKVATLFSGQTCDTAFGASSAAKSACGDECGAAKGFGTSSGCFVRYAELATGGMPDVETTENARCFGGRSNKPKGGAAGPGSSFATADFSATIEYGSVSAKSTTLWSVSS